VVRKATAQDVADLAGVSRSAVSLVLNGRAQGHIARDKQQAIIDAAHRLNYTPNAVALSLRNRRSRTIGVLTWPGASGFACPMLHATLETATRSGYLLIFMDTANDRDHQGRALATLHDRQVDALLVIAPDLINYRPVEVMSTIPTILVNCLDPNSNLTSIVPDERGRGISRRSGSHPGGTPALAWSQDPLTPCRAAYAWRASKPLPPPRTLPFRSKP
jgi:LacI family transcriptional regulator, galactose operon repressor